MAVLQLILILPLAGLSGNLKKPAGSGAGLAPFLILNKLLIVLNWEYFATDIITGAHVKFAYRH
jgi:hypothetical protein